jgi:hypothetical protein
MILNWLTCGTVGMTAVRRGAIFVLAVLSVTCGRIDSPTAPTSTPTQPTSTAPPPRPAEYPTIIGPASVFDFSGPLFYPVRGFTMTSRYVLYDNGAFALQYLGFDNPGSYEKDGGTILFLFFPSDGRSGRSDAIGMLNGELLEVRYSDSMHQADFEDATYKRSR